MKPLTQGMRPQDIVILLKICSLKAAHWRQIELARDLRISQSEISQSLNRSKDVGLLVAGGKQVAKLALMDFLEYGIRYVFPALPGPIVRGMATAHSALPLKKTIVSEDTYVWPYAFGQQRGQAITPLYPSVPEASEIDKNLYALLALVDALRVGRIRERNLALLELKNRLLSGE